ncbi:DNA binding factor subunit TFIIIC1-like protein [Encephalitozoon hellem ATCC 50504]|uniref:RNA polymerase III transcription factor IIIC subunit n=1 Tax=Encephalitozoon hellem TaxID=27973 RepID=A0A9Q9FA47_ENCHE|nr:DNA binding factor subunit TFIIIC1-like protein [Encephalitozoon hellem ATCC 50504]AFM98872.1 DNA binding factor subunit TFIIIC1-like protein [Encephalitozoon hellem ATCC 50504]UTX43852.1 RNA polymerase III transcription factor IIIC subunit [Encephalitozoon hellem]WEL39330.1 RNA polymerase III transcription factor IIIC subunit [Encephalitozoon hellem]|eukprot:XP_003887853.1 DNA binding factor subunit TFIIIC1-like protein [Encephalitozoon hellem ATCC 50504]
MIKGFDIVECPFEGDECVLPLIKTDSGYEMRICNRPDAKKVVATKNKGCKGYFHLEIIGDECKLVGYTENMYSFVTPADFYLPVAKEAREFYTEIYSKMVYGDMNECMDVAEMFDKTYKDEEMPMYPVPIISTVESFENYNFKDFKGGKDRTGDTIHVGYEDEAPENPIPGLFERLSRLHGEDVMKLQEHLFNRLFDTHPILRISNIIRMFKSDERATEMGFSDWKIKKLLPLHAYFVDSGPWRGCWIKFGLDPKKDQSNFKYQIYDSRKSGKTFQVFEAENVVHEVERNRSWYLSDEPSFKMGFHTKALLNLLRFRYELDFHSNEEDEDELEFEVFD